MNNTSELAVLAMETMWHYRGTVGEGVESVDFHPGVGEDYTPPTASSMPGAAAAAAPAAAASSSAGAIGRLCTAGLDGKVRIWELDASTERIVGNNYHALTAHDYSFLKFVALLRRTAPSNPNQCGGDISCMTARWSPCGGLIAACYSDGCVKIWFQDFAEANVSYGGGGGGAGGGGNNDDVDPDVAEEANASEHWRCSPDFRGPAVNITDINDVAFTADSSHIAFVCSSGHIMVYNIQRKSSVMTVPDGHTPCAFGLAMDPLGLLFGTTGSDTRIRFFDTTTLMKKTNSQNLDWKLPANRGGGSGGGFSEVTTTSQVTDAIMHGGPSLRRSSWSPDGALAAFPHGHPHGGQRGDASAAAAAASGAAAAAALAEDGAASSPLQTTTATATTAGGGGGGGVLSSVALVLRSRLKHVACTLTLRDTSTVRGCKFAPKVFAPYTEDSESPERLSAKGSWGPVQYRYALAVWTNGTVVVYTSDCSARHSAFTNLHYAAINDVAWTPNCRLLAVASEDQTVSLVSFGSTLGRTVAFRVIKDSIPDGQCPPLLTGATLLREAIHKCAEDNEGVTMDSFATKSKSGRPVNKVVTARRRARAAAAAGSGGGGGGGDGQQQQQQPQHQQREAVTEGGPAVPPTSSVNPSGGAPTGGVIIAEQNANVMMSNRSSSNVNADSSCGGGGGGGALPALTQADDLMAALGDD